MEEKRKNRKESKNLGEILEQKEMLETVIKEINIEELKENAPGLKGLNSSDRNEKTLNKWVWGLHPSNHPCPRDREKVRGKGRSADWGQASEHGTEQVTLEGSIMSKGQRAHSSQCDFSPEF